MAKLISLIICLLVIRTFGFTQHSLILGTGIFKTKAKENRNIGIVFNTDTTPFNETKFISIDSSGLKVIGSHDAFERTIPLQSIKEISYKISAKEPEGCEACVFLPILIVGSPFFSMNHGKIQGATFIPLITVSTGLSFLVFDYYHRRNIRSYYMRKKQIAFR